MGMHEFEFKGAGGGLDLMDHQNRFYGVFWKKRVIPTSCFLPHQKILFLAKVTPGRRSALMCNCIARAIFNREYLDILIFELQNESTPTFFEQSSSYLAVMFFRWIRKDWSEWIFDLGLKFQNTDNSVLSWLSVTVVKNSHFSSNKNPVWLFARH